PRRRKRACGSHRASRRTANSLAHILGARMIEDNAALDRQIIQLEQRHEADRRGFRLFHELEAESRKQWLVHNLLGHGEASVMYGKPGDGKSVLAEDLGLHIAAGGTRARRGRKPRAGSYVAVP